jgi:protein required for attachment to host cells
MKIEHGMLVMVADGAQVLVFRNKGSATHPVLETLFHERHDNPPSREQGSDAPGRTQASAGERRSAYGETDWHQQAEDEFARHAAQVIEQAASAHPKEKIVVAAAPRTLGRLRKHYGRATRKQLVAEIDKDLVSHTSDDILAVLMAHEAA